LTWATGVLGVEDVDEVDVDVGVADVEVTLIFANL
jgi:hypothetical protein